MSLVCKSLFKSFLVYQGRQTESDVRDGAPGETAIGTGVLELLAYTGITGPLEAKAAFGIKKANCPSVAGTSWKPPYTFVASEVKLEEEPLLQGTPLSGTTLPC